MKAVNIQWNVDKEEILEKLEDTQLSVLAGVLEVCESELNAMSEDDRADLAMDRFRHAPALLDRFLGLPDEVEIPQEIANESYENNNERDEAISNYLSEEYGYCLDGYEVA